MPYPVIQHSYASPSTVAWVIHQKYELAVPLYRQEKEWADLGVPLSRATMSYWILASYRDWLSPVVGLLKEKLLEQTSIRAIYPARLSVQEFEQISHIALKGAAVL